MLCNYIKDSRIERQKKKEKFRIQEEKRVAVEAKKRAKEIEDAYLSLELEYEIQFAEDINETKTSNNS